MKKIGIAMLLLGMALAIYAMTMDVSVKMESQYLGFGIQTPEMKVANLDLISQRQNTLIMGGLLAIVGAILTGIGTLAPSKGIPTSENESKGNSENLRDDRVEFRGGMYCVGHRCFDSFSEAESFFDEIESNRKAIDLPRKQ